jgi:hypothetical protein
MSNRHFINSSVAGPDAGGPRSEETNRTKDSLSPPSAKTKVHRIYRILWYGINVLLVASVFSILYATTWEFSTRRYLTGFSNAVIPAGATPEEKIAAILAWMSHGPSRRVDPVGISENRDPTDTLNYKLLLKVCGSATNAFINLADSSGLTARRLLLLDSDRGTRHVVAEVNLDGRWIVVDPSFRAILRGTSGQLLTRNDLADPKVFSIATGDLQNYDPSYSYALTEHVHLERVPFYGQFLRKTLNLLLPGWEDSPVVSLFVERESFAAMIVSFLILLLLILARVYLRWLGESLLGLRTLHIRQQMRRAVSAFMTSPS